MLVTHTRAPKGFRNLESDVTGTNTDVLSVSNAKVDVSHIRTIASQDTEMEIRNESSRGDPRNNSGEPQYDVAG